MKRATCHLALAALLLLGSFAAHADPRHGHLRDAPGWSEREGHHASDRGRPGREGRRYRDDSFGRHRGGYRGDFERHDQRRYRDRHHYRDDYLGHDRYWGRRGRDRWYPRQGWSGEDYRYWRGRGYLDDRSYGDLQIVLNLPLW